MVAHPGLEGEPGEEDVVEGDEEARRGDHEQVRDDERAERVLAGKEIRSKSLSAPISRLRRTPVVKMLETHRVGVERDSNDDTGDVRDHPAEHVPDRVPSVPSPPPEERTKQDPIQHGGDDRQGDGGDVPEICRMVRQGQSGHAQ